MLSWTGPLAPAPSAGPTGSELATAPEGIQKLIENESYRKQGPNSRRRNSPAASSAPEDNNASAMHDEIRESIPFRHGSPLYLVRYDLYTAGIYGMCCCC